MVRLRTRRRVQKLLRRHSPLKVAEMTGVSVSSVRRIGKEPRVRHSDDEAERKRRAIGRPSKVEKHRGRIEKLLARDPDLPTIDVLRKLRRAGYRGGRSTVYEFVAVLRA